RPAPAITVEWTGRRVVPAATLGAAAAAVGLDLDERVVTTVNGGRMTTDPQLPLVAGDQVAFGCPTADAGLRRKRGPRRVVTHPRPTQEM
ncbi:MAG: hypothetical protein M3Z25_20225, partial [Actinomycetota bacterium]|nr:hypothetical protein [Actinomycetota bacterium]